MCGKRVIIEITVEDCAEAQAAAGADRLELCADLSSDGLTPSMDELARIRSALSLPVMVMMRPRAGDFTYSPGELAVMARSIDAAKAAGADGVVFGCLQVDHSIDVSACRDLLRHTCSMDAVFHRAFDRVADPFHALEQLIKLGFRRVLTSGRPGGPASAGARSLALLIRQAAGRIEVLPAGGIRPHNAAELIRLTGCDQIHSSCRPEASALRPVGKGTDPRIVAELRRVVDEAVGGDAFTP